jgi:hypothetical protein
MFYQKKFCRNCKAEADKILAVILQYYICELRCLNCDWGIDYFMTKIYFIFP